ncbi:MAG: glutaredoxin 3 [Piscirickettsiaceae bacterium]|nr:glutaredoxin 3 [Piscirickettsiaceae bacterium]
MQSIQIVTQNGCSYCQAAKNLLRTREMDYEEIHVIHQAEQAQELLRLSNQRTMPQIFIDGESIGGFTELAQLVSPRH